MTDPRILPPYDPASTAAGVREAVTDLGNRSAVVALSGGQDSTTCLYYAIERYGVDEVMALSFDYGQRHVIELKCAHVIAATARVPHKIIAVPAFKQLGDAALTDARIDVRADASVPNPDASEDHWKENVHAAQRGLPSTFVPGRNLVFLGLAAAFALPRGADVVVTGICQQDRAGYPDCRREFAEAFVDTVRLAMDAPTFALDAPLLDRDKAQTWQLAEDLDCLDVIINDTHTCYEGNRTRIHAWGRGCGSCPACAERARGWEEYQGARETAQT